MKQIATIAKRELSSFFFSPVAYVVLAGSAFGTACIFFYSFVPGAEASIRNTLSMLMWLLILLAPAISMRLLSDEFKAGTIELLMTSPISDAQVVVGKWLGALGFYTVLLTPILIVVAILEANGNPDYGPILTGLLGMLLLGGLYLAIGTFASATTENQMISFLITIFIILFLTVAPELLARVSIFPVWAQQGFKYGNVNTQFIDFIKGLIDLSNFVYFISGIAFFLFLAVKFLESKRWR